jgi:hypothetical protein
VDWSFEGVVSLAKERFLREYSEQSFHFWICPSIVWSLTYSLMYTTPLSFFGYLQELLIALKYLEVLFIITVDINYFWPPGNLIAVVIN